MNVSKSIVTINDPLSIASESYKMLRTSLRYVNIDSDNKVFAFTSCFSEEGKTTTVLNTAVSYAQDGQKTLIIDCDLRRSRVHHHLRLPQGPGLTEYLVDNLDIKDVIKTVREIDNLHVLTAGMMPPNPAEIINTKKMGDLIAALREAFDVIIIDTPPVLTVVDTMVLTKYCDSVVLVVSAGISKKDNIIKAKKQLDMVGANLVGTLLTKAELKNKSHYHYYNDDKKSQKKDKESLL